MGENLSLTCTDADGRAWTMSLKKGEQGFEIQPRRTLFAMEETELVIEPLLPGIRSLTGEKIQWYLGSELRDRIRNHGVHVEVIDRTARKQFTVKPREFEGELLGPHTIDIGDDELRLELYLTNRAPENTVALSRIGTRVNPDIATLPEFNRAPWNSGFLQGVIDCPFLRLTPGTRDGVIRDEDYERFVKAMSTVADQIEEKVKDIQEAEEEKASREVLKTVQKALREALLALPVEEYDWFDLQKKSRGFSGKQDDSKGEKPGEETGHEASESEQEDISEFADEGENSEQDSELQQREFFEYEGPLFSARISPASCAVRVGENRTFRAVARDRSRRPLERDLSYHWHIAEGEGTLTDDKGEIVTFTAAETPGLVRLKLSIFQADQHCEAEALVTVTESLIEDSAGTDKDGRQKGLPGYTFETAPGALWRSRYEEARNLIIINNGHRDFVFASKVKSRRLRYITRLFSKELVLKNFPGMSTENLLERMVELSLYTEENLR